MVYILAFLVLLSIVVVVHEFGHFVTARLCGIKVEEFSLGFGKELFGWHDRKGTRWKICLVPMGGYVKMFGDADPSSFSVDEKVHEMTEEEKSVSFHFKPMWKKVSVIAMGPGMNYIFAIVVLTFLYTFVGQMTIPPVVDGVTENSAAQKGGVLEGDVIVRINDMDIREFTDIKRAVILNHDNDLEMLVLRNGKELVLTLTPEIIGDNAVIGVFNTGANAVFDSDISIYRAFILSVKSAWELTRDTVIYVKQLVMGQRGTSDIRGPLGIAEASGDAAKAGIVVFVAFLAQVSIAIGLINLFPIPMLDGGHLLTYFIEFIRRKPLGLKAQNALGYVGIGFLVFLIIISFKNDIIRIIDRIAS